MKPVKVGVIGVGYLGKFHAEKYASLPESELVGIADTNAEAGRRVSEQFGVPAYESYRELLEKVDAVSIVVPTDLHHAIALECLNRGVDVLVEKPMTTTVEEADDLITAAGAGNRILQVGHLERFNAAVLAIEGILQKPMFIESHRLAPFKDRGTEVDVILDMVISSTERSYVKD